MATTNTSAAPHGDIPRDPAAAIAALEARCTRHHTPCGNGRIVWRRWGSGSPVVLFHGGAGAWSHWIRNIGPLSQRHTVWALDIPGLGESDAPEPLTMEAIGEAVMHGLQMLVPDGPVDIVGFPFGGPVSSFVAMRLEKRLRNLVLVASRFVPNFNRVYPRLVAWKEIADPVRRVAAHRRNLELMMFAKPENIDALAVHIQATNAPLARFFGPKLSASNKLLEFLPKVQAQGLITGICGREDRAAAVIIDKQLAALRDIHPEGVFHAVDAAGHWVQYEAAGQFNTLLLHALSTDP